MFVEGGRGQAHDAGRLGQFPGDRLIDLVKGEVRLSLDANMSAAQGVVVLVDEQQRWVHHGRGGDAGVLQRLGGGSGVEGSRPAGAHLVQRVLVRQSPFDGGEAVVEQPRRVVSGECKQGVPRRLVGRGQREPAVLAGRRVDAVRGNAGVAVALSRGDAVVQEVVEQRLGDALQCGFALCEVNVLAAAAALAVLKRSADSDERVRRRGRVEVGPCPRVVAGRRGSPAGS